jgi:hypothetical protein
MEKEMRMQVFVWIDIKVKHKNVCGFIDPHFLDLRTSWRWVISFMLWLLQPHRKGHQYPLDRKRVGPRVGMDDARKRKFLTLPGLKFQLLSCSAHSQLLNRLCYPSSKWWKDRSKNITEDKRLRHSTNKKWLNLRKVTEIVRNNHQQPHEGQENWIWK